VFVSGTIFGDPYYTGNVRLGCKGLAVVTSALAYYLKSVATKKKFYYKCPWTGGK
jgi:hypothetical protein